MILQIAVMIFLPAAIVTFIAGLALYRFTGAPLRARWIKTLLQIIAAFFAVEAVAITLEMTGLVRQTPLIASGFALLNVFLIALVVRRQVGGPLIRPSLWVATAIATFSLIVKASVGGWLLFGEMMFGLPIGVPIVHLLVRLVTSERDRGWPVLVAGLVSDILLLAAAMLRMDAADTPAYITYRRLFTDQYGIPDWLDWIKGMGWNTENYNYALYVPILISWVLLLWLATRKQQASEPAAASGPKA